MAVWGPADILEAGVPRGAGTESGSWLSEVCLPQGQTHCSCGPRPPGLAFPGLEAVS